MQENKMAEKLLYVRSIFRNALNMTLVIFRRRGALALLLVVSQYRVFFRRRRRRCRSAFQLFKAEYKSIDVVL